MESALLLAGEIRRATAELAFDIILIVSTSVREKGEFLLRLNREIAHSAEWAEKK